MDASQPRRKSRARATTQHNMGNESSLLLHKTATKIKSKSKYKSMATERLLLSSGREKERKAFCLVLCCTFGAHSCISLNYVSQTHHSSSSSSSGEANVGNSSSGIESAKNPDKYHDI